MDHQQPDLFTWADSTRSDRRLIVAVDVNVLIRLHAEDDACGNEVAKALEADWLADLVEICVTPETLVEANRAADDAKREVTRGWIRQHRMLSPDNAAVEKAKGTLSAFFPPESLVTENDISDFNHAVYALAAGAEVLITLDGEFLERATSIGDKIELRVLDPAAFVLELDQITREREYAPSRLAGSRITGRLVQDADRTALSTHFQAIGDGESRAQFDAKVAACLAQPATYTVRCFEHPDDGPLALLTQTTAASGRVTVPLFRVREHRLSPTIARHVLSLLVGESANKGQCVFEVTDDHLHETVMDALAECRFRLRGNAHVRATYPGIHSATDVADFVRAQGAETGLESGFAELTPQAAMNLERDIWPGKLRDSPLPAFVVPIHPTFAMHLFDTRLANADLLGAQADLALACENVYYRSNQACGLIAPARVLWYVKKSDDFQGCMSIRACSVGHPFRQNTRCAHGVSGRVPQWGRTRCLRWVRRDYVRHVSVSATAA